MKVKSTSLFSGLEVKVNKNSVSPEKGICEFCGGEFTATIFQLDPNNKRRKRFCCLKCYQSVYFRSYKPTWKPPPKPKKTIKCKHCKFLFVTSNGNLYCSSLCKKEYLRIARKLKPKPKRKPLKKKACWQCGFIMKGSEPWKKQKFCSRKCYLNSLPHKECKHCGDKLLKIKAKFCDMVCMRLYYLEIRGETNTPIYAELKSLFDEKKLKKHIETEILAIQAKNKRFRQNIKSKVRGD